MGQAGGKKGQKPPQLHAFSTLIFKKQMYSKVSFQMYSDQMGTLDN